jgi:hypothetical protein
METIAMSGKRSQQPTHDSGSSNSRPRDDLRTATKKNKPNEKRDESRDKEDKPKQRKDNDKQ